MQLLGHILVALVLAGVLLWLYLRLEEVLVPKLANIITLFLFKVFKKEKKPKLKNPEFAQIQAWLFSIEALTHAQYSEVELEKQIQLYFPDPQQSALLLAMLRTIKRLQSDIEKDKLERERESMASSGNQELNDKINEILSSKDQKEISESK